MAGVRLMLLQVAQTNPRRLPAVRSENLRLSLDFSLKMPNESSFHIFYLQISQQSRRPLLNYRAGCCIIRERVLLNWPISDATDRPWKHEHICRRLCSRAAEWSQGWTSSDRVVDCTVRRCCQLLGNEPCIHERATACRRTLTKQPGGKYRQAPVAYRTTVTVGQAISQFIAGKPDWKTEARNRWRTGKTRRKPTVWLTFLEWSIDDDVIIVIVKILSIILNDSSITIAWENNNNTSLVIIMRNIIAKMTHLYGIFGRQRHVDVTEDGALVSHYCKWRHQ